MNISILYGQQDPTAQEDAAFSCALTHAFAWADGKKLCFENKQSLPRIQTCAHGQSRLDGTQRHLTKADLERNWGLWTRVTSAGDGNFANPPVLHIHFSKVHPGFGLTLHFSTQEDSYPSRVRAVWLLRGKVVFQSVFACKGYQLEIAKQAGDHNAIQLHFLSTKRAYRPVRLEAISFGKQLVWQDGEIQKLEVLEEIDPSGATLPSGTAHIQIRPREELEEQLLSRQPLEIQAGEEQFGLYFLEFPWRDVYGDGQVLELNACDALGLMDHREFLGDMYRERKLTVLLNELFLTAFPTKKVSYQLDDSLQNETVSGWLPKGSCRTALQMICFALGASAQVRREGYIFIGPLPQEKALDLPAQEVYRQPAPPSVRPLLPVGKIQLVAKKFVFGTTAINVLDEQMAPGSYDIDFTQPMHAFTMIGCTLQTARAGGVRILVKEQGRVRLGGRAYSESHQVFTAGQGEGDVVVYDGCGLLEARRAQDIAQRLWQWHQSTACASAQVRRMNLNTGQNLRLPTLRHPVVGRIERLETDLRRGKTEVKVTGNVDNPRN